MRNLWLLVLLVGAPAAAGPSGTAPKAAPLAAYAELVGRPRPVRVEMTFDGDMNDAGVTGTMTVWIDPGTGRCRIQALGTMLQNGRTLQTDAHFVFTPQGLTEWRIRDGKVVNARRRGLKTVPGRCVLFREMGPMLPFVEAAFGYPHLRAETVLVATPSPLKAPDKPALAWYSVRPKPRLRKKNHFCRLMLNDGEFEQTWWGFSARTGWPMKLVFRGKGSEIRLVVTGLDRKPNLKGAFDLPAEVVQRIKPPAAGK